MSAAASESADTRDQDAVSGDEGSGLPATGRARDGTGPKAIATALRHVEDGFLVASAATLALGGAALFIYVVYDFIAHGTTDGFLHGVLELLEGLLLVFIVTELLHTVCAVLETDVLITEPFLIVGIVAAIRRLVVISAEAQDFLGTDNFDDLMMEMALLGGVVIALGFIVFLLRSRPGPRSGG